MSKICELCSKQTIAGRRIRHHHSIGWKYRAPRKTRVFRPNLRSVKLYVNDTNTAITATVCMKCYKKLRKESEAAHVESHTEVHAEA